MGLLAQIAETRQADAVRGRPVPVEPAADRLSAADCDDRHALIAEVAAAPPCERLDGDAVARPLDQDDRFGSCECIRLAVRGSVAADPGRAYERIVSTEVYEGAPGGDENGTVNTATFTEADGRTTLTVLVRAPSREIRDMIVDSGMEAGMQDAMDLLEEVAVSLG